MDCASPELSQTRREHAKNNLLACVTRKPSVRPCLRLRVLRRSRAPGVSTTSGKLLKRRRERVNPKAYARRNYRSKCRHRLCNRQIPCSASPVACSLSMSKCFEGHTTAIAASERCATDEEKSKEPHRNIRLKLRWLDGSGSWNLTLGKSGGLHSPARSVCAPRFSRVQNRVHEDLFSVDS